MTGPHNNRLFTTTRWTMIQRAVGQQDRPAARALEELCRLYWFPIYAFVRGRGYGREDAEDLTQGFFHLLLRRDDLSKVSAGQGRFRSFLLASVKHYMANEFHRAASLKRGGEYVFFPLDWDRAGEKFDTIDTNAIGPDRIYDREWALVLLKQALKRLRDEWEAKGKGGLFDAAQGFLTVEGAGNRYADAARQADMSEGNLRVVVHRLRKRYRELLKDEIAHTLADPAMIDEELASLMSAFG